MLKEERKIQYYFWGAVWVIVLTALISIAGYFAGNMYHEYKAAKKLKYILGFLPGTDTLNKNPYSRKLNFYTVSQNTPDFHYSAYNADFQKADMVSDSSGFITGGPGLSLQKQPNTIRIFITGGSAAFGSIQAKNEVDDTYPGGTYCYDASIAGYLKKELETEFPSRKFEVINAAVVQHLFNQNFAMYYERLHDYKPDIIISMDGWNDAGLFLFSKHNGNPYQMTDQQSNDALTLELLSRYSSTYSSMLQNLQKQKADKKSEKINGPDVPFVDLKESDYKKIEPVYIGNAQKLFWLFDSYLQQLIHDSVYAIVSLQPMLERRQMNKQLSPLELKFRSVIEGREFKSAAASFDELAANDNPGYFNGMGNEKYNVINFMDAYFFDKYVSGKLNTMVTSAGSIYIDLGKEIESMGADKEFYVDYCHLTPFGNHFVATVFAKPVAEYLHRTKKYE